MIAQEAHILFNRMNMAVYNPVTTGRGFIKEQGHYYQLGLIITVLI